MQIKIKSTRVIKEGARKDGSPYKWISVVADDGSEKGTEYTTFDGKALGLGAGSVIDIGDPVTKEGKLSFKKVEHIVSRTEPPAPKPNGGGAAEARNGMTPADWAEKDRLERWSRECNTCFMGIVEVTKGMILDEATPRTKIHEVYDAALDWAMAHFKPNASIAKPPQKAPSEATKSITGGSIPQSLASTNAGEFYAACLKYFKLPKSKVDAEMPPETNLAVEEGRSKAWATILALFKKPEGEGENEKVATQTEGSADPDHLFS